MTMSIVWDFVTIFVIGWLGVVSLFALAMTIYEEREIAKKMYREFRQDWAERSRARRRVDSRARLEQRR